MAAAEGSDCVGGEERVAAARRGSDGCRVWEGKGGWRLRGEAAAGLVFWEGCGGCYGREAVAAGLGELRWRRLREIATS